MFEFGEITDIDAPRGYVKVYIPETGNTTEWLPYCRPFYAQSIPFEINEQVAVCFTPTGRGMVIGSTPNNVDKPYTGASAQKYGVKFSDGCLLEYDISASKLTIFTPGEVKVTALQVNVTAPDITLNGAVSVIGLLSANGGVAIGGGATLAITGGGGIAITGAGSITTASGDIKAGTIGLKSHKHTGVTTGGGVSGLPTV